MKKIILCLLTLCALLLSGCATAHKKLTAETAVLGLPFLACSADNNCAMAQNWEVPGRKPGTTSQLTPAGCAVHTLVTLGHVAWECRKEQASRGKWIWRGKGKESR